MRDREGPAAMETDRPFREWPIEQLAEQAALHAGNRRVLAGLLAEVALRPGPRAKALCLRLGRMLDGAAGPAGADAPQTELRSLLAAAAAEIALLRARLRESEAAARAVVPEAAGEPGPHRRVYLTPDAPFWLVAEVRRAFRRRYHPDAHPDPTRRRRAEDVFKRAEAVFDEIEKLNQDKNCVTDW